jgi:hypothetical protein
MSEALVQITFVIIGSLLIWCVFQVNAFMKTLPEQQRVDVKVLVVHAGAFGLYMISALIYALFWAIYVIDQTQTNLKHNNIATIVYSLLSFVSQCCICAIFWQLGEKIEKTDSDFVTGSRPDSWPTSINE